MIQALDQGVGLAVLVAVQDSLAVAPGGLGDGLELGYAQARGELAPGLEPVAHRKA